MAALWLWIAVGLLLLGLLAAWALLMQLLGQQGRLLLRLEQLEDQLSLQGHDHDADEAQGLPVDAAVPSFRLPDLTGQPVALEDYRGRRLLLVQWSPTCSFCEQLAPELADLQIQLRAHQIEPVLVSDGDAKANRRLASRYGLDAPILLQSNGEQVAAFKGQGTPVAYLVDEQGRVAAPLAVGSREVPRLVRQALTGNLDGNSSSNGRRLPGQQPLTRSRLIRDGLAPGTTAPEFTLPGVNGPEVSLAGYRGRRVLLVFSDPNCGPCNQLTPELVRLHRRVRDDGLALVMVSRGEPEENRQKCQQHQVGFPVGLQQGWRLSREYGIFSTPVAFLIDEHGVIADKVAVGADEILALADKGRAAGREAR